MPKIMAQHPRIESICSIGSIFWPMESYVHPYYRSTIHNIDCSLFGSLARPRLLVRGVAVPHVGGGDHLVGPHLGSLAAAHCPWQILDYTIIYSSSRI